MKHSVLTALLVLCGCEGSHEPTTPIEERAANRVGLGLYFLDGEWNPDLSSLPDPERPTTLSIVDGPKRFVQELFIVARAPTTEAEGLDPLIEDSDLSTLDWTGVQEVGDDWRLEANGVTYQHQVFYRDAAWMDCASSFTVTARKANGQKLDKHVYRAGRDDAWRNQDDFFERRFVARVVSSGCVAQGDCTNAGVVHTAEGLVQLQDNLHPIDAFSMPANTASIDVEWTEAPSKVWSVAVEHEPDDPDRYGLGIDLVELAAPASGVYQPGDTVLVRMVMTDREGTPLFDEGALPSYADALHRRPTAEGLRYVTFPSPPASLYWAFKDLQAEMETFLAGPLQDMTTIGTRSIADQVFNNEILLATEAVDGWSSVTQATPITPILFSCIFGIDPTACDVPASDVISLTIPADADFGTWVLGVKGRREWMGEPVHAAKSITIQVGTEEETEFAAFPIAGVDDDCGECHQGRASLPAVHHGFPGLNEIGAECVACHTAGFYFEPDARLDVRVQYVHEQSRRLDPP